MSDAFTRTPTGLVGKWEFYTIPTIWIEGPTDVYFYWPTIKGLKARFEPFHGCENAKALITGIVDQDLPYLVILDGDYDILGRLRAPHRRVIRLERYSFENYLWNRAAIDSTCRRHAQFGDQTQKILDEMDRISIHLRSIFEEVVILDIASNKINPSPKILPDKIEQLLISNAGPDIDPTKLNQFLGTKAEMIPNELIDNARHNVSAFLQNRAFTDLFKGHLLMGVILKMFCKLASDLKGAAAAIKEDALVQLLADEIWASSGDELSKKLKKKIRSQVRDLLRLEDFQALES